MDFYARRAPLSPVLGIEEGESRKTCPPGYVKSYLPQFPWSECIPEEHALRPHEFPRTVPRSDVTASMTPSPGPTAAVTPPPAPLPPPPPPPPALPALPRKARFLSVDPQTGDVLDPDTGAVIESASVYTIDTVDTVAIGVGLGFVAVLLTAAGVFK